MAGAQAGALFPPKTGGGAGGGARNPPLGGKPREKGGAERGKKGPKFFPKGAKNKILGIFGEKLSPKGGKKPKNSGFGKPKIQLLWFFPRGGAGGANIIFLGKRERFLNFGTPRGPGGLPPKSGKRGPFLF